MKADNTRFTFKQKNHYSGVRMQQGRVQLDADWNEQVDITRHRVETETVDTVGHCGVPMHHGGFHLVANANDLTTEEKGQKENQNPPQLQSGSDFYISGGRSYLDGILCQNGQIVPFSKQPNVPDGPLPASLPNLPEIHPPTQSGTYLAYLDVWSRHITVLEDPEIREVALGGPDTATRTKTIWQVKLHRAGDVGMDANCLSVFDSWKNEIAPGDGKLAARTEAGSKSTDPCLVAPGAGYRRLENQLYRVEVHKGGNLGTATFKWSRDNGSIVTKWEKQDVDKLTVSSIGRDKVLNFASGQWVELTDDTRELLAQPGTLVQLVKVEGEVLTIDSTTAIGPVDRASFPNNPKVRRWDSYGEVKPTNSSWIDLEDGVQVQFSAGSYKTGDYWSIPARTATADVEWPIDDNSNQPELRLPYGICHHYCRLALLRFDGSLWTDFSDCRDIFPPVTELTNLFYISGDGQEAMPGDLLRKPLQVGVSNGQWPVSNVKIKFKRLGSGGAVQATGNNDVVSGSAGELVVLTDSKGVAECNWQLDSDTGKLSQQVEAALLDAADNPVHLPIRFTANLSVASQVYYDTTGCTNLQGADNVQLALEKLSGLTAIAHLGGDGQEALPGDPLPQLLKVSVSNRCGAVAGAKVRFVAEGNGLVAPSLAGIPAASNNTADIITGPDGIAACAWKLEGNLNKLSQELVATLLDASGNPVQQPGFMRFTANLQLKKGGGCSVTVGIGGEFETLNEAFDALKDTQDIAICLLPGTHVMEKDLAVNDKESIKVTGCSSNIEFNANTLSLSAGKIMLRDFGLRALKRSANVILAANEVTVDRCEYIRFADAEGPPFVLIEPLEAGNSKTVLYWKNNNVSARWSKKSNIKANDYFKAVEPMPAINKALESMVKLSGIDPVKNEEVFNTILLNTVGEIQKLSSSARKKWSQESPRLTINKLSKKKAAPILNFFKTIAKSTFNTAELRENIVGAIAVFYTFGYSEALALSRGVGGWIEDSTINGYLTLHYYSKFASLSWQKATEETLDNRRKFLKHDRQYISVDPVALTLRGNNLYAVISNGYSIMQVMNNIITTGDWGDHEMPETGYEFLRVTGNIFNSNGSGFVCQSLIMTENTFANKAGQNQGITAFILGYSGIFTGNVAASQNLTIETIIRRDWIRESANIISIVQ